MNQFKRIFDLGKKSDITASVPHIATNAWLAVVRAHNICSKSISSQIEPFGLNLLQHEILINLMLKPGQSQQELANKCFSAKSGISNLVSEFEKTGLITRHASEEDARMKLLFLTERGLEQAKKNYAIQNEIVADIAQMFSLGDMSKLEKSMNAASDALKAKYF